MNEMTDPGRFDGRLTNGTKGTFYDVMSWAKAWDPSLVLTDADVAMLLEGAR